MITTHPIRLDACAAAGIQLPPREKFDKPCRPTVGISGLLISCTSWRVVNATETLTDEVNDMIDTMIRGHQPAFLSTCNVVSGTQRRIAAILFFPITNKGIFVFGDDQRKITNDANLSWSDSGEWNMSELEGGVATIKIMSDLLTQLAHKQFEWSSPATLKNVWLKPPTNSCKLLTMG